MIRRPQPASTYRSASSIGCATMRCASNSTEACGRHAAMMSGPNVRFGTKRPSITSHWMRSTPASSSAAISSPKRAKSAGRTEGAISIGRITTTIVTQSVAAGGDAVGRDDDGRVVFVTGALPGERVLVEIDEEHARYARGHVVEIDDP